MTNMKEKTTAPVMDIEDISISYGDDKYVVKNVSAKIDEHSITAIMGPSGCGKTTLLRAINRMHELYPGISTEGKIWLDGENVYEMSTINLRRKVGMVFQRPNPFPTLSIYDNVIAGYRLNGIRMKKQERDEIVEKSLRDVALWDEVKDTLHSRGNFLSGGQQQRLCIARLLAVEPEVLLMDEPCSALDPISTMKIEELVSELKQRYTIIIVTHNMQQAARVSDYTAFFLNGDLVEHDQTDVIFTRPQDQRTEDYITGRFG